MKTPHTILASTAFAFFFVASPTILFAEESTDKEKKLVEAFKAADKDSDGKLTLPEATAGMPRIAKNFARIDKDKKGFVTLEQIKSMMRK
jgi:Ca2+-binding EF-hand superfamily protein